ncbi:amidohydrolase [Sphaerisporangium siamense]|nr:amidohydrolase [Sphaerisporangium siamense]
MNSLQQSLLSQSAAPDGPLALTGVTVVDTTGGPSLPGTTVVVADGRIAAVDARPPLPPGTRVVDAPGAHVIPGLWDMHVHVFDETRLPLFLANGVTGIRHMGMAPVHTEWRDRLTRGELLAPRTVVAGRIIDGPNPMRPNSIAAGTEREAREAVRMSVDDGADFLKVYSLLPRDAYFALADEAARLGVTFAGHVPFGVTATEAASAGQRSIEHLEGIFLDTSARAAELRGEVAAIDGTDMAAIFRIFSEVLPAAAASADPARAAALFDTFARNETWHVPTLSALQAMAFAGGDDFPLESYLPYVEPGLRDAWSSHRAWGGDPERRARNRDQFDRQLGVTAGLHEAGVDLLAGTDTFVPGFSLHDELELLVHAGLTPLAALRAATWNPARFLGVTDAFGSVEVGKAADLLVLDGDPLREIGSTRKIRALVHGGRLFDRAELDGMASGFGDEQA